MLQIFFHDRFISQRTFYRQTSLRISLLNRRAGISAICHRESRKKRRDTEVIKPRRHFLAEANEKFFGHFGSSYPRCGLPTRNSMIDTNGRGVRATGDSFDMGLGNDRWGKEWSRHSGTSSRVFVSPSLPSVVGSWTPSKPSTRSIVTSCQKFDTPFYRRRNPSFPFTHNPVSLRYL